MCAVHEHSDVCKKMLAGFTERKPVHRIEGGEVKYNVTITNRYTWICYENGSSMVSSKASRVRGRDSMKGLTKTRQRI